MTFLSKYDIENKKSIKKEETKDEKIIKSVESLGNVHTRVILKAKKITQKTYVYQCRNKRQIM